MAKLNEKQRAEAKDLLEDYQKICDMLADVERRAFSLYLTSNKEDEDFAEVSVSRKGAKDLLLVEKQYTVGELAKLGIEVSG